MDSYSYRIDRRPERVGGGWRLQLLQNGVEVDEQVFPAAARHDRAQRDAYMVALGAAKAWLAVHTATSGKVLGRSTSMSPHDDAS